MAAFKEVYQIVSRDLTNYPSGEFIEVKIVPFYFQSSPGTVASQQMRQVCDLRAYNEAKSFDFQVFEILIHMIFFTRIAHNFSGGTDAGLTGPENPSPDRS